MARLQGHTEFVWSLASRPDGATLASVSGDATARLRDTAPPSARHRARREAEALGPQAERIVAKIWRDKSDSAAVVEALGLDQALCDPQRQAAVRAVLRRAPPLEVAPGDP